MTWAWIVLGIVVLVGFLAWVDYRQRRYRGVLTISQVRDGEDRRFR